MGIFTRLLRQAAPARPGTRLPAGCRVPTKRTPWFAAFDDAHAAGARWESPYNTPLAVWRLDDA